jgi:hypothetical protein
MTAVILSVTKVMLTLTGVMFTLTAVRELMTSVILAGAARGCGEIADLVALLPTAIGQKRGPYKRTA